MAAALSPFCHRLWTHGEPWYQRILAHPYMQELAQGTLARERFACYLVQDHLFLDAAARALSLAAGRARNDDWIIGFNRVSTDVLMLERSLHEDFFLQVGVDPATLSLQEMAPTNEGYSSYLLTVASERGFPESLSALLPCFWLYRELGQHILAQNPHHPLTRQWAEFYGGEEYDQMTSGLLAFVERVGADCREDEREKMVARFVHSCRYEWLFWQMCYSVERWPQL